MATGLTEAALIRENHHFHGSGARSEENRAQGFRPAFMDTRTRAVYDSRFADGRPAPFHLLDGLPDEAVLARHPSGRAVRVQPSIVSGFVLEGRFLTRDEVAMLMARAREAR
jgi:hypothetical protein